MKIKLRITSKHFHFSPEMTSNSWNGKCKAVLFFFLALFFVKLGMGQQGPLNWTERINVESNDLFLIWNSAEDDSTHTYQKVYKYKMDSVLFDLPVNQMVSKTASHQDSRVNPNTEEFMDAAKGRFNMDPYDDVVSIWSSGTDIEISIPKFDTSAHMWTNSVQFTIEASIDYGRVYVRTGNFDNDDFDEFILSYLDSNDMVHLELFDVDSITLEPIFITEISDVDLEYSFAWSNINYFLETGDLNGDGIDEVIVQYKPKAVNASGWNVKVKIYEVTDNVFIAKANQVIQPKPGSTIIYSVNMAIKAGQFKSDDKEELAFITIMKETIGIRAYVYVLELNENLDSILFNVDDRVIRNLPDNSIYTMSQYNQLSLDAGDLDNDSIDEIIFDSGFWILVHETEEDLSQIVRGQIGGLVQDVDYGDHKQSYNYLKIADVNNDNRQDIVTVKNITGGNSTQGLIVTVIEAIDSLETLSVIGSYLGDESDDVAFHNYAIAFGNFDGYNFTIGEPTHYTVSEIVQPIVILNAPPIHFDMFDEDIFDLNECYNGGDCDFEARYTKENASSIEVSTTVESDWAISTGLSVSGSISQGVTIEAAPLGVGGSVDISVSRNYENHLLYTHGSNFSNTLTNSTTVTVGVEVGASEDDRIYSTVTDYDVWEYPVYHGNETFARNTILAFVPINVQATWFPSKSYNAVDYIPDHEVSNILSYRPYANLNDNPNLEQTIVADYTNDSFVLDANSDYNWFTSSTEFSSSLADTVKQNGLDVGIGIGNIRFDGDYNNKKINTHETSVTEQIQLDIHLGSVDMGIGDVKYTVTPYSYWANNGALVVDYAAKPEIAPPGSPETWWSEKYGSASDPTFILPWRLDPEKGFAVSEEAKREQTKDIQFKPAVPLDGDTVDIMVRVRNFSLVPTPGPVSVSFYLGDPDENGIPIIGISGESSVDTDGALPAGANTDVVLKWAIPDGLTSYPRIYAVLDEDDLITEVHANNNKGFNVLGATSSTPIGIEENTLNNKGYSLLQSYPNPFSTTTSIQYTIPTNEKTTITVYDQFGRVIKELLDKFQHAGTYVIPFNGTNLNSGVYYYTIRSGNFKETKKMLLIK
jgi:hypothetical protein